MSRKSRTTLTFTISLPLPQKCSQRDAADFIKLAVEAWQKHLHDVGITHPFAFLATNEVIIKQTGRETVYL